MELHHLRCAIVLAEQENFTRAALALHMKQPSLSYVINRLEADLGAKLFDRLPRRVVATPVGRAFLEQARASLLYADAARAVVAQSTGIIAGDLRIVSTSLTTMELSDSLTAFHVCHPSVRFLVHEPAGREEVVKQVRDGRCELGVIRSTELPEGLVSKVLAYQEQVAVFSDKLIPAPAADPISLTSLGRYPLVAPPVEPSNVSASTTRLLTTT